jgi:hypothetical protein
MLFLSLICAIAIPAHAQTTSAQQTLQQYVAELQSNPNDTALRGKIIAMAQTMKPAPAIPEEARRHYVLGKTFFEGAKKPEDFNDAIAEFKSALLLAPWWPEANRDYALTLEAAEHFDEAAAYVKLYMATNPGDERLRAAQDELYKIEARQRLASKAREESAAQPAPAPPQDSFEALLKEIDGRRYVRKEGIANAPGTITFVIDVSGRFLVFGEILPSGHSYPAGYQENRRIEILGRETTDTDYSRPNPYIKEWVMSTTYIINEDGESITQRLRWNDGDTREKNFEWQR